uniref:Uncharacterized protein n=1 Tax=Timema poppense TaxID=170557 RepID=A0A7R9CQB2_TIMPO|nr:unnamed protein product [Timema poppensis]
MSDTGERKRQEIVGLIKAEPKNEDGYDTCRLSEIKTEVLPASVAQLANALVVSSSTAEDGEIEDEFDTSNSVDEIVKNEIMLHYSSFEIMDSKIDHLTAVDKSEEDIVVHMEEERNVKQKIVTRMLSGTGCEAIPRSRSLSSGTPDNRPIPPPLHRGGHSSPSTLATSLPFSGLCEMATTTATLNSKSPLTAELSTSDYSEMESNTDGQGTFTLTNKLKRK